MAATATARGGDEGGDVNYDNFAIAMVINLDLRTAGVRRYVARLNLTGGMAVSLFFQGGDGGGGGVRGAENMRTTTRTTRTAGELVDVLHAYGQRVPQELLALGPPPPLVDPPSLGGDDDVNGKGGDAKGGCAGAATSRMTAIAEGGIRRGRTRPWRRRTTTTATAPPQAHPIRRRRYNGDNRAYKTMTRRGGGRGGRRRRRRRPKTIGSAAWRGGEGEGEEVGTTAIITTCRTSGGRRQGPCIR